MVRAWEHRIISDPLVLRGKPCIRDTRIPVALILGYLATGAEASRVIEQFPDLTTDDVAASLDYARDLADFEAAGAV